MEEHRLKQMPDNYDEILFNRLFLKTEGLRKKLAREIDCRRFGVGYEDVVSWFNTKFIFVFTKYYGMPEETLKAHLINSLQTYKFRIMKNAYNLKNSQTIISAELVPIEDEPDEINSPTQELYYTKLMEFMKSHLSENAYTVLDLQLNPTPYILKRISPNQTNLKRIPDDLLLEYFELGFSDNAYKYLKTIKKEIKGAIELAKTQLTIS